MPNHREHLRSGNSPGKNQRKLSPRSHSSRVGQAWSRHMPTGYKNFKCPVCGSAVRYLRVRGNLKPVIECSNQLCKWTVDELVREDTVFELAQKPKGVSTRQWCQSSVQAVS